MTFDIRTAMPGNYDSDGYVAAQPTYFYVDFAEPGEPVERRRHVADRFGYEDISNLVLYLDGEVVCSYPKGTWASCQTANEDLDAVAAG